MARIHAHGISSLTPSTPVSNLFQNIGEVGNFLSYAYAPASLVAPLGTVALVANCFFAPLMLHEQFRKRDFFGIILAVVGSITVVLSSKPTDVRLDKDGLIDAICQPIFIGYTIFTVVAIMFLTLLSRGNAGRDYIFVDVGIVSCCYQQAGLALTVPVCSFWRLYSSCHKSPQYAHQSRVYPNIQTLDNLSPRRGR